MKEIFIIGWIMIAAWHRNKGNLYIVKYETFLFGSNGSIIRLEDSLLYKSKHD